MNRTDEISNNAIKMIDKWKSEGVLEEKLKEYGLAFEKEQTTKNDTSNES